MARQSVYIYIYIYICVCVCVCVCGRKVKLFNDFLIIVLKIFYRGQDDITQSPYTPPNNKVRLTTQAIYWKGIRYKPKKYFEGPW